MQMLDRTFDRLPGELFEIIVSFLPAYSFVGKETIHTVSKQWNENLILGNQSFFRRHIDDILASCENEEDTLNILTNKNLTQQLSVNQFFYVFSFHRDLTLNLLQSGIIFPTQYLETLVLSQLWLSKHILETQILTQDNVLLLSEALDVIACSNLTVAEYFLSKLELGKTLGFNQNSLPQLTELKHVYEIWDMVDNEERKFLIHMGTAHLSIALRILNDPIALTLTTDELCALGSAHFAVIEFYMKNPDILEKLKPDCLEQLAAEHIEFATHILDNDDLSVKIGSKGILNLCLAHKSIAKKFFNDPELQHKWFPTAIALKEFLSKLGQTYCTFAEEILADPELYRLAGCTPFSFSIHPRIRRSILDNTELMDQFWETLRNVGQPEHSADINTLYTTEISLFEQIMCDPTLSEKLSTISTGHSITLAQLHGRMAELLIDNKPECVFDSIVSQKYIFLSQKLSQSYAAGKVADKQHFSPEELNTMKLNASIFAKVQELVAGHLPAKSLTRH